MKIEDLFDIYQPLVNRIIKQSNGFKYTAHFLYADPEIVTRDDFNDVIYVHYLGIIERCHIACLTSMVRNLRWIEGSIYSIKNSNVLSFSANLRGFLEASSDSWDLMQYLPKSIYKLTPLFHMVINDNGNTPPIYIGLKELEDRLIHFSYARRPDRNETVSPEHINKTNISYIRKMEDSGVYDIEKLYSLLCQLTHPAADSLNCFIDIKSKELIFNIEKDEKIIDDILNSYENTIEGLVTKSMNASLLSLVFLARILPKIHAPLDEEISGIGNAASDLKSLDIFIKKINTGTVDLEKFRVNPLSWMSQ